MAHPVYNFTIFSNFLLKYHLKTFLIIREHITIVDISKE